jgi:HTH-type transcriptional regulator/antitoxin HigA
MNIKPIRSDDDLRAAFKSLERVFQAQEGTPEADEMEILVTLIEAYERKHFPIGPADPIEAIKFRM